MCVLFVNVAEHDCWVPREIQWQKLAAFRYFLLDQTQSKETRESPLVGALRVGSVLQQHAFFQRLKIPLCAPLQAHGCACCLAIALKAS